MVLATTTSSKRKLRVTGAIIAAIAGLIHVPLAIILLADPRMTGEIYGEQAILAVPAFFLVLGGFQLVWALVTLRSGSELIGLGMFGFLGSIVLYLVALAAPLPAGVIRQTLTLPGAVTKIVEAAYVIVSLFLVIELSRPPIKPKH